MKEINVSTKRTEKRYICAIIRARPVKQKGPGSFFFNNNDIKIKLMNKKDQAKED